MLDTYAGLAHLNLFTFRNITLSDIDILLNPDSSPNEDVTKPVVVHISLSVPLNMDAPTHIGRMTVELKTDEILGVR